MPPGYDRIGPLTAREDRMDFEVLFARLRGAMAPYGAQLVVTRDAPGDYYVESGWVRDDGYPGFFGAVQVKKRYVSYHLMPVYAWPDLLDDLSPDLRRRMQGKSCFNFTKIDDATVAAIADLTRQGFTRYEREGLI